MSTAEDSQAQEAIAQTRSTAKWIIAAFAAVGASLVAGLQLTGLGKLEGQDLAIAVVGLVVALLGVVVAILLVARVLTPQYVLFDEIEKQVGELVKRDRTLLHGTAPDLPTLLENYQAAYGEYVDLSDDPERRAGNAAKQRAMNAAEAKLDRYEGTIGWLSNLALSAKVGKVFSDMLSPLAIVAIFTVAGVIAFAYASNRPEPTTGAPPHASRAVGQTPVGVRVRLSRDQRALLAPQLGRACRGSKLWGLAIGGRPVALDVVTLPTARCRSVRVVVTPKAGIAIHRSPAPRVRRLERLQAR